MPVAPKTGKYEEACRAWAAAKQGCTVDEIASVEFIGAQDGFDYSEDTHDDAYVYAEIVYVDGDRNRIPMFGYRLPELLRQLIELTDL